METKKLTFPLKFTQCPSCGGESRLAESIIRDMVERGKLPKGVTGSLMIHQAVLGDPSRALLTIPVLTAILDICAMCGTMYCVIANLEDTPLTHKIAGNGGLR